MNIESVMMRRKAVADREIKRLQALDLTPVEDLPQSDRELIASIWLRGERSTRLKQDN